jgi:hypothetical protein
MSNVQEIKDIVTQLQQLHIGQTKLLKRLAELNGSEDNNNALERDFVIGDRVRIKNPRFLQPTGGTVSKVTAKRITVLAANGTSIVRAPKNITLE